MNPLRVFVVVGTRPEAIKLAPLIMECQRRRDRIEATVCVSGQHREMLQPIVDYFGVKPDLELDVMQPGQNLSELTARCISALDAAVRQQPPHCVIAQGDTTSVMAASLVAFYQRIPFVHVEAGLRTGDLQAPWPEELNRRVADIATSLYCAPTERAVRQLVKEEVPENRIRCTGNTVIDALHWTLERLQADEVAYERKYARLENRPMVLMTGHRRENFGEPLERICRAIGELASRFSQVEFVYPVHLNPRVDGPVREILGNVPNVHLEVPAAYPEFVWLMKRARVIVTDSGGVQEEAPSLATPVLVTRATTERPEAVEVGAAKLVGDRAEAIIASVSELLTHDDALAAMQVAKNPYGDGHASRRIVDFILSEL